MVADLPYKKVPQTETLSKWYVSCCDVGLYWIYSLFILVDKVECSFDILIHNKLQTIYNPNIISKHFACSLYNQSADDRKGNLRHPLVMRKFIRNV
jgi:hypothetical protein